LLFSCKNYRGFTLAEVLVTLLVIGVVAALTIPQLIQSAERNENKVALKKALGVLNNSLSLNMSQNGAEANDSSITSSEDLAGFFGRKLNVISGSGTNSIYINDGIRYTFTRNGPCNTTDTNYAAPAQCFVLVDINGDRTPNTPSSGNTPATYDFKDQYYFVIRNITVLPSSSAGNSVAAAAVTNQ
jgi:prepilin-type N-terminal cleavage/methylation domain-containing protein